MPATSKDQAAAARIALAAKRGKFPVSMLHGASAKMYSSMSEEELKHFTKLKGNKHGKQG